MAKRELINRTVGTLENFRKIKFMKLLDFADFLLKKYEEKILQKGIENLVSESDSFGFLYEE